MAESREGWAYRGGVAAAVAASFLTIWTTFVRDDGNGAGSLLLVMAAVVGGFSAWFQAAGMARTMLGVATMQAWLGLLAATAPSTANSLKALALNGVFAAIWLASATFFRAASKKHLGAEAMR